MKIAILIDNNPHPSLNLLTEHGLSIYFEADGLKWLLDVGASNQFYFNAKKLGINVEDVDFLVLSHGHSDHTGGLRQFIKINQKATIFMSAEIIGKEFYSYRLQSKRNITIDQSIVSQHSNRFIFIDKNLKISKNVGLVCQIPLLFNTPKANNKLFMKNCNAEHPDDFNHEVALALNTSSGIIVFSGCSHKGILNIIEACSNFFNNSTIVACIGGTHLIDSNTIDRFETEAEILEIGKLIADRYPQMQLITGHCTGRNTQKQLSIKLGKNFDTFYSGKSLYL